MIIGIVARDEFVDGKTMQVIAKRNLRYLENKANYMGILTYNNGGAPIEVLKLCDGVIIPGGKDIFAYHNDIVTYCYNNNIPILGICMGHQIIGLWNNKTLEDKLIEVDNHCNNDLKHKIRMKEDTWLCRVLGDEVTVNSRHRYALDEVKGPMVISAYSDDGVIEAIEDINENHFMVGVQWHPEDLETMDNLYNAFIKEVWIRKKKRDIN